MTRSTRTANWRTQAVSPPIQSGRRRRQAAHNGEDPHPGLLAGRGDGARPRRRLGPGRAIYLTAAFTGVRQGELIALHRRDVDLAGSAIRVRASYTNGHVTSPKSGKVRSVPMAPNVAEALARLSQRELWTRDDDLVFVGITGSYLDGPALSKRCRATLQRARFARSVPRPAPHRRVQEWMGHANVQTTMQYLH